MIPDTDSIGTDAVSFLNRDHIVSVTIHHVREQTDSPWRGKIEVTTTVGTTITIPASAATLDKFVDELANHVESNFVSISFPAPKSRFIDDDLEFISIVPKKPE